MNDDGFPTSTSDIQRDTEEAVLQAISKATPELLYSAPLLTIDYLKSGLNGLDSGYTTLESSRPWLCYWMTHSLSLLGEDFPDETKMRIINTLNSLRSNRGGYGGNILQLSHTAPTYASVMALITVNSKEAFQSIQRGRLYRFFLSLKRPDGSFRVQEDGESDTRALYTVLAVASITNILTKELAENCHLWLKQTQNWYDGGIGGEPGNESHGGYAYCGLASLVIMKEAFLIESPKQVHQILDIDRFVSWLYMRQMTVEGGFQGRINKLVDSCYSFWQGACFMLLNRLGLGSFPACNVEKLYQYVLGSCLHTNGGLKDKPYSHRDYYHTCYALSGLAVVTDPALLSPPFNFQLRRTDPVYNINVDKIGRAKAFFAKLPSTHKELMDLP